MLAFAQDYNKLLTHIITDFYDHLLQDKSANKILSALSPTEQQHLKARQARSIGFELITSYLQNQRLI